MLWRTNPLRKPKIVDFLMETASKIRVTNRAKMLFVSCLQVFLQACLLVASANLEADIVLYKDLKSQYYRVFNP